MATYRKTDNGALKLMQNRITSKRTRRLHKIERLKQKITALKEKQELGTISAVDHQLLLRQEFEVKQAEADAEQLKDELLAIAEKIKESKNQPEPQLLEDVESVVQAEPLDAYLQSLGMDPSTVDGQEVNFTQM